MKMSKLVLSLVAVGMLFASCGDDEKKEAEAKAQAQAQAEKIEMEAKMVAEKEAAIAKAKFESNTIAAIAMGNENFTTLVTALKAAGLAETFQSEGEYTVFAPTNEAFGAVPKAALTNLLKAENKTQLQDLLKYHVIKGEWKAEAVIKAINDNKNAYTVTTLNGQNLVLSLKESKVMITDAKGGKATVVMADVDASNGVIHAIDKVVMPKK